MRRASGAPAALLAMRALRRATMPTTPGLRTTPVQTIWMKTTTMTSSGQTEKVVLTISSMHPKHMRQTALINRLPDLAAIWTMNNSIRVMTRTATTEETTTWRMSRKSNFRFMLPNKILPVRQSR